MSVNEEMMIGIALSYNFIGGSYEPRKWMALFGVSPNTAAELVNITTCNRRDLLWALNYLKEYPPIDSGSCWACVSQKTYVKRINIVFDCLNRCLPPVRIFLPFLKFD